MKLLGNKLRVVVSSVAIATAAGLVAVPAATATVGSTATSQQGDGSGGENPRNIQLQDEFDHLGAEVHSLKTGDRTSYYIDEGAADSKRAVVFIGGQGTSLQAFQLTEFARTSRERLGLRMISVERNGFGESPLDLELGYADYAKEVVAVLDHLGIKDFSILAISGGGAYAAQLAAAVPDRVISLHAAAAVSSTLPTRSPRDCSATLEQRNAANEKWTHNPKDWWGVAPDSPVLQVPGWQVTAYLDAARSFFIAGQLGDPSALSHEGMLPCLPGAVVDASRITAPTYLYWGGADTSVPVSVMEQWQAALPNVREATVYPGEGHTVQYRHWEQIMVDLAGYAKWTVVCNKGESRMARDGWAKELVKRGATLGLCAWSSDN